MNDIVVIIEPFVTMYVEIGIQGAPGSRGLPGVGYVEFDSPDEMNATPGAPGLIAYPNDMETPDQFYKWSVVEGKWVIANI